MMYAEFTITEECMIDQEIPILTEAVSRMKKLPWAKGYLISHDKEDRSYTIHYFEDKTGRVFIKCEDKEIKAKQAIEASQLLNHHATLIRQLVGWANDDFLNNQITIELTYKFNS